MAPRSSATRRRRLRVTLSNWTACCCPTRALCPNDHTLGASTGETSPIVDQFADADHARPLGLHANSLRGGVGVFGQNVQATTATIGVEPGQRSRHRNETDQCLLARQGRPRRAIGRLRDVNSPSRQVISPQQPVTAEPVRDDDAHRNGEPDSGRHCHARGDAPVPRTGEHGRGGPTGQRRPDRPPTVASSAVSKEPEQQHPHNARNGADHDRTGSCRERFTVDRPQRTRTPTTR